MRMYSTVKRGQYTGIDDVDGLIIISEAKSVGKYAFAHSNVRKVVIDVQVIEQGAFYNCKELEEVIFSDNVIRIEESAFYKCAKLEKVNLPKHLEYLGKTAFAGCYSLQDVTFYPELKEIGEQAFSDCKRLYYVQLCKELKKIGAYAFLDCFNLSCIDFDGADLIIEGQEQDPENIDYKNVKSFLELGSHPFLGCDKVQFRNANIYKYVANGTYKRFSMKLLAIWLTGEEKLEAKFVDFLLKFKGKKQQNTTIESNI